MKQRPWLFLLPTILLMSISAFVPLMTVFNYSLHYIFAGSIPEFVGLQNYVEVLNDANFQQALFRQLAYSFIVLIIEIWPIRTSGSFFTTTNATFIWLIVGMLFSHNLQNRKYNL